MQVKFKKVRAGEYRAQLSRPGDYLWVVRDGRKWVWFRGGYIGYDWAAWTNCTGPFKTMKEAIDEALANVT